VPATYLQIADELAQRIARRRPGAAVESENELAGLFHVNRLTARAALGELERRYAVRRRKGRGTFVARRVEYRIGPDHPPSWTATVRAAGARPRTENERVRSVRPPLWARRELGLAPGERALQVERRRWVDDELATWATSYLRPDVVPGLERHMGPGSALYHVLTTEYGLEPRRAWSRCEFEVASEAVAGHLGLRGRDHVSVVRGRLDCARRGAPIEVGVAYNRMDVLNVVYEFGSSASGASAGSEVGG
jgi:GntR family transcriptional regulator